LISIHATSDQPPSIMAPYPTLSPRSADCDPGYNWYTCNVGGDFYFGCCSVDPCGFITFCPAGHQNVKSVVPDSTTTTTTSTPTSATVDPRSAYPTLDDNASPTNSGPPPQDGDYGTETTISSTYTDSTGQAGVAIAATVGTLVFIVFIVCSLWLYRFLLRRVREAKEEERRIKKERRHKKVYVKPPSTSSSGLSSDRASTRRGRSRSRSKAPGRGLSPSGYEGAYGNSYPTEVDYRCETTYGVHYSTQLPAPRLAAKGPPRNISRIRGLGGDTICFEDRTPIVPPVSPGSSSTCPDTSILDETNPHNYRCHSVDPITPIHAATMPSDKLFIGMPEMVAPDESSYTGTHARTHAKVSNNTFQTLNWPVSYSGGPVIPVWDSDAVFQEV
jgi:hypothetical protein